MYATREIRKKNYRLKIQRATKFECSKSRDKKVKGSNKPF